MCTQLVVATVPDLQGYEIDEYGYQLGRAWGIGQKGTNNGAILLIAPAQRKLRIEVGYGLEGVLTDAVSSRIIRQAIVPRFKAGDIAVTGDIEVLNKDLVICHLDRKIKFDCEFEVKVGRGFNTGDENKRQDMPIGVIAIDSIFSPVVRVKYAVEATRVGQMTDFDKLILDIWTDGRVEPSDALLQASAILRHHLDVFVNYDENAVDFEEAPAESSEENAALKKLLNMSVNEIELSVRAANCLNNANITTVGELAMKTEQEMLKYRNFGKKSLNEIKEKLEALGLSLGMKFDERLLELKKEA